MVHLDPWARMAYQSGDLYAMRFTDGMRWAVHTLLGWSVGETVPGLLESMVDAAWGDLPSDYVPPVA